RAAHGHRHLRGDVREQEQHLDGNLGRQVFVLVRPRGQRDVERQRRERDAGRVEVHTHGGAGLIAGEWCDEERAQRELPEPQFHRLTAYQAPRGNVCCEARYCFGITSMVIDDAGRLSATRPAATVRSACFEGAALFTMVQTCADAPAAKLPTPSVVDSAAVSLLMISTVSDVGALAES